MYVCMYDMCMAIAWGIGHESISSSNVRGSSFASRN